MKLQSTAPVAQQPAAGFAPADLNHDGHVTLAELLQSALVIGACIFAVLSAPFVAVVGLFRLDVGPALAWWARYYFPISFVLAVLGTSTIGIWRMVRYERMERDAARVRAREWAKEDALEEWRNGIARTENTTRLTQADVDVAAWLILCQYYKDGTLARGKVKDVSDTAWNIVNDLLQKRGIRKGRHNKLEPEDLEAAWALWLKGKIENRSWVTGEDGILIDRQTPPPSPGRRTVRS